MPVFTYSLVKTIRAVFVLANYRGDRPRTRARGIHGEGRENETRKSSRGLGTHTHTHTHTLVDVLRSSD